MSQISFAQAKTLVLARLRQDMERMPVAERERPRYVIDFKTYSVLDLMAEVERETDVGKRYVFDRAKQLGYVVS